LTKRDDGVKVPVLVTLVPEIQNGQIAVDSTELTIGSLTLPDFIADIFVSSAFDDLADNVVEALGSQGRIEEIGVTPNRIELLVIARSPSPANN